MNAAPRVKSGVHVEGLKPVLRQLSRLGPDLNRELRASSKEIAAEEASKIRAAAGSDQLSAAVATTIRARSDRLPSIVGGGARRLSSLSGNPRAGEVFFGAEYGGGKRKTTRQFRPHRGRAGYFVWPTLRDDQEHMLVRWSEAVERAIKGMQ